MAPRPALCGLARLSVLILCFFAVLAPADTALVRSDSLGKLPAELTLGSAGDPEGLELILDNFTLTEDNFTGAEAAIVRAYVLLADATMAWLKAVPKAKEDKALDHGLVRKTMHESFLESLSELIRPYLADTMAALDGEGELSAMQGITNPAVKLCDSEINPVIAFLDREARYALTHGLAGTWEAATDFRAAMASLRDALKYALNLCECRFSQGEMCAFSVWHRFDSSLGQARARQRRKTEQAVVLELSKGEKWSACDSVPRPKQQNVWNDAPKMPTLDAPIPVPWHSRVAECGVLLKSGRAPRVLLGREPPSIALQPPAGEVETFEARVSAWEALRRLQSSANKPKAHAGEQRDASLRRWLGVASTLKARESAGGACAWRAAAWAYEKCFFQRLPAVQAEWSRTATYTTFPPTASIVKSVQQLKQSQVPGLGGTTFGEVFRAFGKRGCPIWLVGGVVLDFLAGDEPNDVDAAALCEADRVSRIIRDAGWRPRILPNRDATKWKLCFEGFALEAFFTDTYKADTSVSTLLWSVGHDILVDPSGHGKGDAEGMLLRPAVPAGWSETQSDWTRWYGGGTRRLVRYLRMRMRPGWQPFSACFQVFMLSHLAQDVWSSRTPELTHFVHESLAKHNGGKVPWLRQFRRFLAEEETAASATQATSDCPWKLADSSLSQSALASEGLADTMFRVALVGTCSAHGIARVLMADMYLGNARVQRGGPVLLWPHMFGPGLRGPLSSGKVHLAKLRWDTVEENCGAIAEAFWSQPPPPQTD